MYSKNYGGASDVKQLDVRAWHKVFVWPVVQTQEHTEVDRKDKDNISETNRCDAMVAVQVNDKDGAPLTKVIAGETVGTAKVRIEEKLKWDSENRDASFFVGLEDVEGVPCLDTDLISADKAPYRCEFSEQPQQKSRMAPKAKKWFCVTGTIERPKSSAGDRFKLVQLARGGFYRPNEGIDDAFQCLAHPDENKDNLRLISVKVVFAEESAAINFAAAVDSYVIKSHGVGLYQGQDVRISEMDPFEPKIIYESHYVPREADREAPLPVDSPVWAVEINSIDQSAVTSYYSYHDTVYK